jgi:iron(III) transport system permease protein
MSKLAALIAAVLTVPVLGILGSWLAADAGTWALLAHQWRTVMPGYIGQSAVLVLGVALGVALMGGLSAALVTLFEFPGRRLFEWALLLPLAMPAYVLAYAATDFLQFSGPLQTSLRTALGASGALWPDVRSLWAAVILFTLCLYPYAYLLVRAALAERAVRLMEAARLLGAGARRRLVEVALPLARPAAAAGVMLALMEVLADYGVGAYFGLTTFTTGIYRAWLVMNDRIAAAQLATVLLAVVVLLLWLERRAQRRLRFSNNRLAATQSSAGAEARPITLPGWRGWVATALCALPVLLGFVLPMGVLLRMLWLQAATGHADAGIEPGWQAVVDARFAGWAWTSFKLAALSAALAVGVALLMAAAARLAASAHRRQVAQAALTTVSLGYAVPGAVIAVGILLPVGWVQSQWPALALPALVTGTVFGLLYAYLVRFSAVALQSVEAGYARIPASIDETAQLMGTRRSEVLALLHLPLLRRSAVAAGLLVFVDVMKELPATLVLRPFNSDTLAVVAYQFARDERLAEAALPSLAIVLVGLLPVVMLSRALRRAD